MENLLDDSIEQINHRVTALLRRQEGIASQIEALQVKNNSDTCTRLFTTVAAVQSDEISRLSDEGKLERQKKKTGTIADEELLSGRYWYNAQINQADKNDKSGLYFRTAVNGVYRLERPFQTSTPLLQSTDLSSSTSSGLSSVRLVMQKATQSDGQIDYQCLTRLMREDRRKLLDKAERERAKRMALEELCVKYGEQRARPPCSKSERKKDNLNARLPSTSSTSSLDSSDLLLELVRRQLNKHKTSRQNSGSGFSTLAGSSNNATSTPEPTKEKDVAPKNGNFYQSTSLFNCPTWPKKTAEKTQAVTALTGRHVYPMRHNSFMSNVGTSVQFLRNNCNDTERQMSAGHGGWWWVSLDGIAQADMPVSLKESLQLRRPSFVASCNGRLRRMEAVAVKRHNVQQLERQIGQQVAAGQLSSVQANHLLSHYCPSKPLWSFSRKKMISDTRKRVRKLPEYLAKREQLTRQFDMATNRAVALMYKQRLMHKVICRENAD